MRQSEKLVLMANQIGRFFAHKGPEQAPALIADHLRKFWDPRMRATIRAYVAESGEGLDPWPLEAISLL